LAGVQDDLVDPGVAEREREGCGFDELRPIPDNGEDLHAPKPTKAVGQGDVGAAHGGHRS
jgi:hypothetical protein